MGPIPDTLRLLLLLRICCELKQVSVILQLVYITKFFHWEMGYMNSMDIQHDRAGYYLCWGCLVSV